MSSATRVVLSYPETLSDRAREAIEDVPFRSYLGKAHDEATEGDVWEEFVGVGCCGDTLDLPLRVEAVDGGSAVDEDTEFVFESRDGDAGGGWRVQSEAGPR